MEKKLNYINEMLLGYYYDIVPAEDGVEAVCMMRLDEMAKLI